MGAEALVWTGAAVTDTVPVVRALEAFDRFYTREFPKMVTIAYALSGSRMAAAFSVPSSVNAPMCSS